MHTITSTASALLAYRRSRRIGRSAVLILVAGAAVGLQAQSPPPATSRPSLDLRAYLAAPLNLTVASADHAAPLADVSVSSSLASPDPSVDTAVSAERLSLSDSAQPPPRRRYGRPRYSDRTHNADGSSKLAFVLGGGFTVPTGSTGRDLTLSYRFQGGAGINFSKKFGIIAQFDYDHFGLPGSVITAQQAVYQGLQIPDPVNGGSLDVSGLDANAHIYSLTLNPIFTISEGERSSTYVVVGGGFYHKAVNFTLPVTGGYCDYYYGCYQVTQNQNFDTYTNNAGGINGGIGFTYKPSRFANEKLFVEARYVWVDNQGGDQNPTAAAAQGNFYPKANDRTGYVPVTVGIRW